MLNLKKLKEQKKEIRFSECLNEDECEFRFMGMTTIPESDFNVVFELNIGHNNSKYKYYIGEDKKGVHFILRNKK